MEPGWSAKSAFTRVLPRAMSASKKRNRTQSGAELWLGVIPDYAKSASTDAPFAPRGYGLHRQELRELFFGRALEIFAVAIVAALPLHDPAEFGVGNVFRRHVSDGSRNRNEVGAAADLERGHDAEHFTLVVWPRDDHQAILPKPVGDEVDEPRLVGHRHEAAL